MKAPEKKPMGEEKDKKDPGRKYDEEYPENGSLPNKPAENAAREAPEEEQG